MKDLENMQREARQREKAYRRGWHQGWVYACQILVGCLLEAGTPKEEINRMISVFEEQYIMPWRAGQSGGSQHPDFFNVDLSEQRKSDEGE